MGSTLLTSEVCQTHFSSTLAVLLPLPPSKKEDDGGVSPSCSSSLLPRAPDPHLLPHFAHPVLCLPTDSTFFPSRYTQVSLLQEVTDRSSPGVPNVGPRSVRGWPHRKLLGSSEIYTPPRPAHPPRPCLAGSKEIYVQAPCSQA